MSCPPNDSNPPVTVFQRPTSTIRPDALVRDSVAADVDKGEGTIKEVPLSVTRPISAPINEDVVVAQVKFLARMAPYLNQATEADQKDEFMDALHDIWFKKWPEDDSSDDVTFIVHRKLLAKEDIRRDLRWLRLNKGNATGTWQECIATVAAEMESDVQPSQDPLPPASQVVGVSDTQDPLSPASQAVGASTTPDPFPSASQAVGLSTTSSEESSSASGCDEKGIEKDSKLDEATASGSTARSLKRRAPGSPLTRAKRPLRRQVPYPEDAFEMPVTLTSLVQDNGRHQIDLTSIDRSITGAFIDLTNDNDELIAHVFIDLSEDSN